MIRKGGISNVVSLVVMVFFVLSQKFARCHAFASKKVTHTNANQHKRIIQKLLTYRSSSSSSNNGCNNNSLIVRGGSSRDCGFTNQQQQQQQQQQQRQLFAINSSSKTKTSTITKTKTKTTTTTTTTSLRSTITPHTPSSPKTPSPTPSQEVVTTTAIHDDDDDDDDGSCINNATKTESSNIAIAGIDDKDSESMKMKSFGGIPYRDSDSSSPKSNLFRVVFVLGGPGAGKGTQCELLTQNYPCVHLSAGQLLRDEASNKDGEHSALIEECLVRGQIVPVKISLSLLQKAMRETDGNDSIVFLIDGFPRNFDNLNGWKRYVTNTNTNTNNNGNNKDDDDAAEEAAAVWGVLYYDCPLEILETRVMKRSKESPGRSDDNLKSLRKRFKTFQDETVPVINALKDIDSETKSLLKVEDIRGNESLEKVWEKTQQCMNDFIRNDVLSANAKLLKAIANNDTDAYRNLCADEMFEKEANNESNDNDESSSAVVVMAIQEEGGQGGEEEGDDVSFKNIRVNCAEMTFITGKKVSVSYDRTTDSPSNITFRETRIWSHQGNKGWRMVHFFRS